MATVICFSSACIVFVIVVIIVVVVVVVACFVPLMSTLTKVSLHFNCTTLSLFLLPHRVQQII